MRNLFRALSLLGLACLVAACQTTQGHGELKLTPAVAQYFEKYLLEENPTDFYVAADSSYALYTYCRDLSCSAADNGAWNLCQQNSAPAPCAKLTNKNEILWINAGNFMPYKSELVKKRYGSYFYDPNSPYKTSASKNKSKSSSALKIHPPIIKQEINDIRRSGKIELSPKTADHFVNFLSSETSKEFYVSADGKSSHTSICGGNYSCSDQESVLAIRRCAQKSQTSSCHLFSNNDLVLWRNAGNFMPYKSEVIKKRFGNYFYDDETSSASNRSSRTVTKPVTSQEIADIHYSEDISFSKEVAEQFINFLSIENLKEFYVSRDGKTSHRSFCDYKAYCTSEERVLAIRKCEKKSNGSPCHYFANKRQIFWDNPGNFMPFKSEKIINRYGSEFYTKSHSNFDPNKVNNIRYSGKVLLSDEVALDFITFLTVSTSKEFFISEDGRTSSTSACGHYSCSNEARIQAIQQCQAKSNASPCHLFSNSNIILWKSPGSFMPYNSDTVKNRFGTFYSKETSQLPITQLEIDNIRHQGKVRFSWEVAAEYTTFLTTPSSSEFYVSQDGKTSFASDCRGAYSCTEKERVRAIRLCQKKSNGSPCHLFSTNDLILWEEAGNFMPYRSAVLGSEFGAFYSN